MILNDIIEIIVCLVSGLLGQVCTNPEIPPETYNQHNPVISIMSNPTEIAYMGITLFFFSMWFILWLFRKYV